ncbi:unnamed protein product [Calypogeia fissa]
MPLTGSQVRRIQERGVELEGDFGLELLFFEDMATQRARFRYKTFKGRPKDDPDEWIEDFVGTTQANGEDGIKMTILAGSLEVKQGHGLMPCPVQSKLIGELSRQPFSMSLEELEKKVRP